MIAKNFKRLPTVRIHCHIAVNFVLVPRVVWRVLSRKKETHPDRNALGIDPERAANLHGRRREAAISTSPAQLYYFDATILAKGFEYRDVFAVGRDNRGLIVGRIAVNIRAWRSRPPILWHKTGRRQTKTKALQKKSGA